MAILHVCIKIATSAALCRVDAQQHVVCRKVLEAHILLEGVTTLGINAAPRFCSPRLNISRLKVIPASLSLSVAARHAMHTCLHLLTGDRRPEWFGCCSTLLDAPVQWQCRHLVQKTGCTVRFLACSFDTRMIGTRRLQRDRQSEWYFLFSSPVLSLLQRIRCRASVIMSMNAEGVAGSFGSACGHTATHATRAVRFCLAAETYRACRMSWLRPKSLHSRSCASKDGLTPLRGNTYGSLTLRSFRRAAIVYHQG